METEEKNTNDHASATTWNYTGNIWENIQDGLAENPYSEGLIVPGANGGWIKGIHHFYLHSLIINCFV